MGVGSEGQGSRGPSLDFHTDTDIVNRGFKVLFFVFFLFFGLFSVAPPSWKRLNNRYVEAVKFFWKRKRTRKHLTS